MINVSTKFLFLVKSSPFVHAVIFWPTLFTMSIVKKLYKIVEFSEARILSRIWNRVNIFFLKLGSHRHTKILPPLLLPPPFTSLIKKSQNFQYETLGQISREHAFKTEVYRLAITWRYPGSQTHRPRWRTSRLWGFVSQWRRTPLPYSIS